MTGQDDDRDLTVVIPSCSVSGSIPQLLHEIDGMLDSLAVLRREVAHRASAPRATARMVLRQRGSSANDATQS